MASKNNVAVLGAGKIGSLVAHLLSQTGDYSVKLIDFHSNAVDHAHKILSNSSQLKDNISFVTADFTDGGILAAQLGGCDYVLSCAPFHCNSLIAEVAKEKRIHYLDLTEDVQTTEKIKKFAQNSASAFIPQCGLAPGFISILTNDMVKQFESVEHVKMRVGALPLYPNNRLNYNLTWSTEGLINEYCNPCEVISFGKRQFVPALEGEEKFHIDGQEYEAFYTSGGLGSLAQTLEGRVKNLDYKSIRYLGHRELMCFLLDDLKFREHRENLTKVFERSLPFTQQDVVLIYVSVTGQKDRRYTQENYMKKVCHKQINEKNWCAIQVTTASALCVVLDLHSQGKLPARGFIRQEDISFEQFLGNRFGKYYV